MRTSLSHVAQEITNREDELAYCFSKKKKKKVGIINDGKEIKERQEQEVMESLFDGSQETGLS